MANILLQLVGVILEICALMVINFLFAVYITVKRLGGNLEKRHIYTISGSALTLFLSGMILFALGA